MIESFTDRNTMKMRAHEGRAEVDDSWSDNDTEWYNESDTDSDTESDTENRKYRDLFSSLSLTSRINNNCTSIF